MKKIILTLLISLFFIPSVNALTFLDDPLECFSIASPSSTKNIFLNDWGTADNACGIDINSGKFAHYSSESGYHRYCINHFIPVEPNTTYTLTNFNSSFSPMASYDNDYIFTFDENFKIVSGVQSFFEPPYTFTTESNSKYFLYCAYKHFSTISSRISRQLEVGAITSVDDLTYVEYEEYIEEPIVADTTLDSFYTLYVSKIKEISQYAIENKFLLGTITLIILFIILEIILRMFRKGGYR